MPSVHSFQRIGSVVRTTSRVHRMIASQRSDRSRLFSAAKKRVVFLGTPEVAASTLRRLHEESLRDNSLYEIVSVVTQPPKRRKRRGKEEPSPVGKVAEELEIPVLCPEQAKDNDFLDELESSVNPDLCITAAYGQYLPKRFLATPTYGTVNIHPSLLPRWRGASPVQRSLEAGENPLGVSLLFTVSKMDAGPIIAQQEEMVDENDTATTVLPQLFEIGTNLLIDSLPDLVTGKITMETATAQDEGGVVNAAMIHTSEAELQPWHEGAKTMHDRLRGFSMWPGGFLFMTIGDREEAIKYKILETRLLEETAEATDQVSPGPSKGDGLRLVCHDGSILEINRLQPATRKPMDALSFVNGLQGKVVRWIKSEDS